MLIEAKLLATLLLAISIFTSPIDIAPQDVKVTEVASVEQSHKQNAVSRGESRVELGNFKMTAYTAGPESTGKKPGDKGYGITKSGATVTENVTIAVDPKVIPLGSTVYIETIGYRIAQDTGGDVKGNRVDIYFPNLKDARKFGRKTLKVWLIK